MSGPWRIMSQDINGRMMYIAGRQKNLSEPLHGGNVEYHGMYSDNHDRVEALVAELNAAEQIAVTDDQEIRISRDGNQWCALRGKNLQEGESGFGMTPEGALMDLLGQVDDRFGATTAGRETIVEALHTALVVLNRAGAICNVIPCELCPAAPGCIVQSLRNDLIECLSREES